MRVRSCTRSCKSLEPRQILLPLPIGLGGKVADRGWTSQKTCHDFCYATFRVKTLVNLRIIMRDLYLIRCLCVFSVWLFSLGVAFGQQIDTTAYHELSGVEVVEKVRPSVTREGTPLQIMDRAGIDRLGVQDLSEAVKRFSGVTVQDYGGIGGLKTVSVRSLGAKHTAVSYDGVTITDAQSGQVDISPFLVG